METRCKTSPRAPELARAQRAVLVSPQLPEGGEETPDTLQEDLQRGQRGQNGSSPEAPADSPYSLKIKNTATCNSGTYRCTLQELGGQRNISATVILKVTGEVTCWTCLFASCKMHACPFCGPRSRPSLSKSSPAALIPPGAGAESRGRNVP